MHSFLQVQNKLQMEAVTNLLSVGDSHIEMDAVHLLGKVSALVSESVSEYVSKVSELVSK